MRLENKNLYLAQDCKLVMENKLKLTKYLNELVLTHYFLLNHTIIVNQKAVEKLQDKINKVSQQLNQL